jgi:signal transduction histidine kinase
MSRITTMSSPWQRLDQAGLDAMLSALPFAVYGLDRNLVVLYNNGSHALAEFLADGGQEPDSALIGSVLLDHVPLPERQPLQDLADAVLNEKATEPRAPRGVDFLHASAAGLKRLRVLATRVDRTAGGVDLLLTCHESGVAAPATDSAPSGTARLDVARQLAATLNHEINNPLFIVSATLEDLLADSEDPAIQRRLRAALDSVWRVASAVKQLQEIRQVVTTAYIEGLPMVDLDASISAGKGDGDG